MPTEYDYERECNEIDEWLMEMEEEFSEHEEDAGGYHEPQ